MYSSNTFHWNTIRSHSTRRKNARSSNSLLIMWLDYIRAHFEIISNSEWQDDAAWMIVLNNYFANIIFKESKHDRNNENGKLVYQMIKWVVLLIQSIHLVNVFVIWFSEWSYHSKSPKIKALFQLNEFVTKNFFRKSVTIVHFGKMSVFLDRILIKLKCYWKQERAF